MKALPTERFSDRAGAYARHRPGYPKAIVELLQRECKLSETSRVADIAAGTGLLTKVFLEHGNTVVAVEPNAAMLAHLSGLQANYPGLSMQSGTAESTGLPDASVDFVTVAQAMHWVDLERARREFARILRSEGWCPIVYNERRRSGDAFHDGYEKLLQTYGVDYQEVQGKHLSQEQCAAFFQPCGMKRVILENSQDLDLEGLTGRIVSSSYMPTEKDPRYPAMQQAIASLFEANQIAGRVRLAYGCAVSFGQLLCS
jgi:ubiquinone/menaquinone biosynthesis C-methylase UbiE